MPETPEILHEQLLDKALAEAAAIVRQIVEDARLAATAAERMIRSWRERAEAAEAENERLWAALDLAIPYVSAWEMPEDEWQIFKASIRKTKEEKDNAK